MKFEKQSFFQLTAEYLISGDLTEIRIKDICGFSSKSCAGHLSHLVCSPIVPVIYRKEDKFILLNVSDTRLTNLIESLSVEATVLAFVLRVQNFTDNQLRALQFLIGHINPHITAQNSLEESLRALRRDKDLQQALLEDFAFNPRRDYSPVDGCKISAESINKFLGLQSPVVNTIKKMMTTDKTSINCERKWAEHEGKPDFFEIYTLFRDEEPIYAQAFIDRILNSDDSESIEKLKEKIANTYAELSKRGDDQ
ncbi:hypothetical protein [Amphritea sp. HPY]|uniref:hypothetical protein n=1 Tax=Amphritea sp. HPY TaxID=3421652 RepID=UPI003D7DF179